MSQISVTVNGVKTTVEADARPTHIFAESKEIVVCKIHGELRDLWRELADGDVVESIELAHLSRMVSITTSIQRSHLLLKI